ncbi:MAG: transporter substrate-binding domain-containing protein [Prolixibacteraceae bacterium]
MKNSKMMWLMNIGMLFLFLYFGQYTSRASENNQPDKIRVGVYDNPPKIFMNNNKPDGIFIDVVKSIAKNENLKVEYVSGNWNQLIAMLNTGEIDVLPDVAFSKERDSIFCLNTLPLLNSWIEIYTRMGIEINSVFDLKNHAIGVLKGSIQQEYFEQMMSNDSSLAFVIMTFPDYTSSVRSLKNHEIDALIANRFFYFSDLCDKDILSTGEVLQFSDLHFAFNKSKAPELVKLFDKNILQMQNDPASVYYKSLRHWLDKDYSKRIPRLYVWLMILAGAVFIVVSVFAVLLQYKVNLKTRMLRKQNVELKAAKKRAEQSDQLKTVFLQNISHEIRTPMNGILGFLSLLKEADLEEERQRYVEIINANGDRLLNTFNNLIEISKIQSNQISVFYSFVNVSEVMKSHYDFFSPLAIDKGIKFKLSNQVQFEKASVQTDKHILDLILTNLINNALKFTKKGVIEIGNYLEENSMVFFVKDSGIGIPESRQKAIFERFVQADLKITRSHEGAGLGLSIVKAYVEKLEGLIWVDSEVNKGSTFFFSIPL